MKDMHDGIFGTNSSGHTMVKNILMAGYYRSTMVTDCHHHLRTCHKCQIYADKVHMPPIPLNVMTAPWPFAMWGIYMIGEIKPTASNGHRFILVAIDYSPYYRHFSLPTNKLNIINPNIIRFLLINDNLLHQ